MTFQHIDLNFEVQFRTRVSNNHNDIQINIIVIFIVLVNQIKGFIDLQEDKSYLFIQKL